MAGRGRGRGKPIIPLAGDQMGFGKIENAPPILQPPPSYPPLEYKAVPTNITQEMRYLLQLKKNFADYFHESFYNVQPIVVKKDIERYSDRLQDMLTAQPSYETRYNWTRMPEELKPKTIKRKKTNLKISVNKKIKDIDVSSKLQELEQKETTQHSDNEDEEKEDENGNDDVEDKVDDEEENVDEEMDEGTDYVNSYFDNGEMYEDDDENLSDGGTF